jgi:outer membrane protein
MLLDSTERTTDFYTKTPAGAKDQSIYTFQKDYAQDKISFADQFRNNYSTQIGLTLHIPILNYFQNRNKVALAKINLLNAQYVEENTRNQLKQNVEQAYVNMNSALQRYNVLIDQVKAFTESFRTAEIRFNAGSLTSVDFVVAKNNMDRANSNLISARYDYYIRIKILDYYQGKLAL